MKRLLRTVLMHLTVGLLISILIWVGPKPPNFWEDHWLEVSVAGLVVTITTAGFIEALRRFAFHTRRRPAPKKRPGVALISIFSLAMAAMLVLLHWTELWNKISA